MEVLNIISVITNIDKVCRTCLNEKQNTELCFLYDVALDDLVWKLTNTVKPISGDGMPEFICKECAELLKISLAFKEQCQKSEERLRQLLDNVQIQSANVTLKELLDLEVNASEHETSNPKTVRPTTRRRKCKEKSNWSSFCWPADDESSTNLTSGKAEPVARRKHATAESKHACKKCKKAFRSAAGLKVHLVKHGKKLKCEVCSKQFCFVKHLNNHTKSHKDYKPHVCETCKKAFATSISLKKHMRTHGGEKRHLCITCGRRFFEPGHLAIHMRTHTGEKPVICKVCGKRFSDPHSLVAHNKIHTGERNYECKICGKKFAYSFVLTAHNRIHTGEKPYRCSICGTCFATSSYLTIHKRTHTQEKPFNCESCPKAFVSRCALVAHNMTHTGEKRFQCSMCGKRFARGADMNIHMRSHTGEKPYACEQCPKRYHTSSNLAAHKRSHLGIRNHVCSICGKRFGDSRILKGHTRIHTGEKPYACNICNNRYSQSGQLAAHRKTHINQTEQTKSYLSTVNLDNSSSSEQSSIMQLVPVDQLQQQNNLNIEPLTQYVPLLKINRPGFNVELDSEIQMEDLISMKTNMQPTDSASISTQSIQLEQQANQPTIRIFID